MSPSPLTILLLDDNPDDRILVRRELEKAFSPVHIEEILEEQRFAEMLERNDFQAVITDYQLRWTDGIKVLHAVKARYAECPVVMFTNTGSEEIAVEAMKAGLDDYLLKRPAAYPRVPLAVKAALNHAEDRRKAREAEEEIRALNAKLRRAMMETHHRVKNSLQIISALVDMQLLTHEEDTIPRSDLQRLTQYIKGLSVIHDVLTQHARTDAETEMLSANEALNSLVPILQDMATARRIRLKAEDVALPVSINAGLAMIINELVNNAMKYGCGDIRITFSRRDDTGVLVVHDQGSGFPADFDATTFQNTGLYLVQHLVEWDLKGAIRFENSPHGGAVVTVEFPIKSSEQ